MKNFDYGIAGPELSAWLKASSWRPTQLKTSMTLWVNGEKRLVVPADPNSTDYQIRLAAALQDLAGFGETSVEEVARLIALDRSDVVEWAFAGGQTGVGSVGLGAGTELLAQIRRVYVASAASTIFRRGYFGRRVPVAARTFADEVQLAPTRSGSYIFPTTVRLSDSPQGGASPLDLEVDRQPFARRVSLTLATAMASVESAVNASELPTSGGAVELVSGGVSYELVTALSGLLLEDRSQQVKASFGWSPAVVSEEPQRRSVALRRDALPALRALGEILFETGLNAPQTFFVYVTTLHKDNPAGAEGGVVNVRTVGDKTSQLLHAALTEENYQTAVRAHELHSTLEVDGTLVETAGHRAKIEPVTSVRLRLQGDFSTQEGWTAE